MIDRPAFLADAQKLLAKLEKDLRARCDDMPEVGQKVTGEYKRARDVGRTGQTLEEWRADAITQQAAAWVLSCVFVRFLEDNRLIDPPKLAGPGERLNRARDEHELFFRSRPYDTAREYLLSIFDDLAKQPGTRDLFGEHNPLRQLPGWLSPDAAKDLLLPFFQRIDAESGRLVHDFTDPSLDTRFLGDLYQDLSEAARKKYALLQTPVFVEEFILERTLEPAIAEFGLDEIQLIDPACGSGHFLLGAFARLLDHWTRREPATPRRELVQRALAAVHGVDLNPYAVAIGRFRLLLAAWQACGITSLANAPDFRLNLACGDSLLHGSTRAVQGSLRFPRMEHHYQPEDAEELDRLLRPGTYHAVVANPPYPPPKDSGLNKKYRERYSACHGQYSLAVPFMQRIFDLGCEDGFTGQITANTFMRAEFGKKLVENCLADLDLTHVVDAAWAVIPGHNTPTTVIFGRTRSPLASTVRVLTGIRGEIPPPAEPANGKVWQAIEACLDRPGVSNPLVRVEDVPRERLNTHPWTIGVGGAELKELLERNSGSILNDVIQDIGRSTHTGENEAYYLEAHQARTKGLFACCVPLVVGEDVRDYSLQPTQVALFPYSKDTAKLLPTIPESMWKHFWLFRTLLRNRKDFGQTVEERGLAWHEHSMFFPHRYVSVRLLFYAFQHTHNHFVYDSVGGKVSNQTAPVIKLAATASETTHFDLSGLLNSSVACFWLKQVCFPRGGDNVGDDGARVRLSLWDVFHNFNSTRVREFPLPRQWQLALAHQLDAFARNLAEQMPVRVLARWDGTVSLSALLDAARTASLKLRGRMVALQENLDWQCYHLYGLIDEDLSGPSPSELILGQRAFEIVLARKMRDEGLRTAWFDRHGSTPTAETDDSLTVRRIAAIESNPQIALIEQPEYKRRWSDTPWEEKVEAALHDWLLDRLESYFDLDGRMQEDLTQSRKDAKKEETLGVFAVLREVSLYSVARVADAAGRDPAFQAVAELYRGRPDFDVVRLVTELVEAESVPLLPVLRYKPSGLDKRRAWERTWELQRQEDAIDRRATKKGIGVNDGGWSPATDDGKSPLNPVQADVLKKEKIGPILPPPKYKSADFQSSIYWRLRGGLDVPKERWVSFPHCEGADGLPLIAWAGYDHLQLAKAIAAHYVHVQEQEGGRDDPRLLPLLAGLVELLPWLKQWHNEVDADGYRMGDYYEGFVQDEARQMNKTPDEVRAWRPPARKTSRKAAKTPSKKE